DSQTKGNREACPAHARSPSSAQPSPRRAVPASLDMRSPPCPSPPPSPPGEAPDPDEVPPEFRCWPSALRPPSPRPPKPPSPPTAVKQRTSAPHSEYLDRQPGPSKTKVAAAVTAARPMRRRSCSGCPSPGDVLRR